MRFRVFCEALGDGPDDALEFEAESPELAAVAWAEGVDSTIEGLPFASGGTFTVTVDVPSTCNRILVPVRGGFAPTYEAWPDTDPVEPHPACMVLTAPATHRSHDEGEGDLTPTPEVSEAPEAEQGPLCPSTCRMCRKRCALCAGPMDPEWVLDHTKRFGYSPRMCRGCFMAMPEPAPSEHSLSDLGVVISDAVNALEYLVEVSGALAGSGGRQPCPRDGDPGERPDSSWPLMVRLQRQAETALRFVEAVTRGEVAQAIREARDAEGDGP